jgi:hypothetical protein
MIELSWAGIISSNDGAGGGDDDDDVATTQPSFLLYFFLFCLGQSVSQSGQAETVPKCL